MNNINMNNNNNINNINMYNNNNGNHHRSDTCNTMALQQ